MIANLLAAVLLLSSATAFAATKGTHEKEPSPAAPASAQSGSNDRQVYCIEEEPTTGSRVYTQECKTKVDWARQGVDVDALLKQKS